MQEFTENKLSETGHVILKKAIRSKGFIYTQVKREGNIAIYRQDGIIKQDPRWEVIVIRKHDGYNIAGNEVPPAEMYPRTTQWGRLAWTVETLELAEAKFKTLIEGAIEAEVVKPEEVEVESNEDAAAASDIED